MIFPVHHGTRNVIRRLYIEIAVTNVVGLLVCSGTFPPDNRSERILRRLGRRNGRKAATYRTEEFGVSRLPST